MRPFLAGVAGVAAAEADAGAGEAAGVVAAAADADAGAAGLGEAMPDAAWAGVLVAGAGDAAPGAGEPALDAAGCGLAAVALGLMSTVAFVSGLTMRMALLPRFGLGDGSKCLAPGLIGLTMPGPPKECDGACPPPDAPPP